MDSRHITKKDTWVAKNKEKIYIISDQGKCKLNHNGILPYNI